MVLIIKGQSCFRKRMSDWNNIQKLPKNGDHCERREWFDGSGEEEALQSDVLSPMWRLGPCVGVNCYECRGLGHIVRGGGRGADGDGDKVDNGDTRDLELT